MTSTVRRQTAFERALDALVRLGHHPKGSGDQRYARCPAHDDNNPSLAVKDGREGVLLTCHANCPTEKIADALGLTMADLFNEPRRRDQFPLNATSGTNGHHARPVVTAEYRYLDETGQLLYVVERREPKTFRCKHRDQTGKWAYSMNGLRRVLYRLPDVLAAAKDGKTIYLVEGEKDADRLAALGHAATCNPHGAGKWRDEYAALLAGAHVVVIQDRDDAGRAHGRTVIDSLRRHGARATLVEPAEGKDISDHLDAGRDLADTVMIEPDPTRAPEDEAREQLAFLTDRHLQRLRAEHAAKEQFTTELATRAKTEAADGTRVRDGGTFLLDLPPTPPAMWGTGEDILWAKGESLLIAGPQGVGKTTIAGQLLRAVLGIGTREPLGLPVARCTNRVLYLAMDRPQQAQRNLGRMFHAEHRDYLADVLRFWVGPPPADFATAPETLINLAKEHDADVVFVDSLKDAAIGLSKDEVGAGYNRARQLALAEGVQLVELHHMVKNSPDGRAPRHLKDVYGSAWLTAGAGSVILLWGEAGDPVIELHHLKQPMNEVGPLHVEHNRVTGESVVYHDPDTDVIALARRCASTGISAREAAVCMYQTEHPTKAQVEKARRKLGAHADEGLLLFRPQGGGPGVGRAPGDRWYPAAPSSWDDDGRGERYR